ncbi:MAG: hypothetical protein ABIS50_11570 [Luteolibacter sp.]|uniref:hypothetical protein n=1 Tax=Luteolibacter sp. TaxID=1962973 RepID=UPI003264CE19
MSRWNDKAEAIACMLRDVEISEGKLLLEGVGVMINRTEKLLEQVGEVVGKADAKGCVIIKHLGGKNPDRKSSKLRLGARYSISLWCQEMVYSGMPPDDLSELMGDALHGWVDPRPGQLIHRLEVDSIIIVPAKAGFLVYEIIAEVSRV